MAFLIPTMIRAAYGEILTSKAQQVKMLMKLPIR